MVRLTPKIPIATISGGDPGLSISKDDWQRIETAYENSVPLDAREQIHQATLTFLSFTEGEKAALPVSKAKERVIQLKKVAVEFQKAIVENPQDAGWDARNYADHLIRGNFQDAQLKDPQGLGTVMTSFIVACNHALAHLNNLEKHGRREGDTWGWWVCRMTEIIEAHQLPTQVRKDTDKNVTGKPSPFVALIRELQTFIPQEDRRSTHSDVALSEAIGRVRRPRSGRKKFKSPPA